MKIKIIALGKIKEIANDVSGQFFKTAIILVIVWMAEILVSIIAYAKPR